MLWTLAASVACVSFVAVRGKICACRLSSPQASDEAHLFVCSMPHAAGHAGIPFQATAPNKAPAPAVTAIATPPRRRPATCHSTPGLHPPVPRRPPVRPATPAKTRRPGESGALGRTASMSMARRRRERGAGPRHLTGRANLSSPPIEGAPRGAQGQLRPMGIIPEGERRQFVYSPHAHSEFRRRHSGRQTQPGVCRAGVQDALAQAVSPGRVAGSTGMDSV